MNWIEIITLRSNGNVQESFIRELLKPVAEDKERNGLISMKIYRNPWIDTDMSFHLYWKSTRAEQQGSAVGLRLAQALKEFGLVNHSAWVEEPFFRKVNFLLARECRDGD
jgi:hypothetical protein